MSVEAGTEQPTQGQPDPNAGGTSGTPTDGTVTPPEETQAPYAEQLASLPESVRPLVEPIFKDWDSKVTERFQKVHSEYEPWKDVTTKYDPESVQQALALAQYLQDDPKGLYERLAEAYGFAAEQGQGQPQQPAPQQPGTGEEEEPDPVTSKLSELEQALVAIATHLQTQQLTTEQQNNITLLNQELSNLKEKHGDYNEQFVLTMIANGADPESAVLTWKQELQNAIKSTTAVNDTAPPVVGSGTSVPSTQEDLTKMGEKDTQDLVVKLLREANQSG